MLTNVNHNNNNCNDASSDVIKGVTMEAHQLDDDVTNSEREMKNLQGGGDSPSRGVQFKHHESLQHALDYQPGDTRNSTLSHSRGSFPFGQSRRMGTQSVYPGQGASYSARHFSWYKPGQPCLPAVGEEEAEKIQLRASPSADDLQSPNNSFSNSRDSTSPIRDSNSTELIPSQRASVSPSHSFSSSGESGNIPIINSAIHSEGLSISDPANLSRNGM